MPSDPHPPTRAERERLRALAEQATPGPWLLDSRYPRKVYCDDATGSIVADTHAAFTPRSLAEEQRNAEYIAACSPAVVLSLLAALDAGERDTARVAVLESDLDEFAWMRPAHHPDGLLVRLDWFVGDGDGHAVTTGATIREAIDAYLEMLSVTESEEPADVR